MPSDTRSTTGRIGEEATAALYRDRGFDVIVRNWRCGLGEIDVVARRGRLLVFCEVKTRSGDRFCCASRGTTLMRRRLSR